MITHFSDLQWKWIQLSKISRKIILLILVYGKAGYMWKNAKRLIETVRKFTEVHATVNDNLPDFDNLIINHGVLIGPELHALMRKVKIFLGLGFLFEGPAPLEAIANGVVFINPSFNPPKSRKTSDFFKDKPTLRELTSQNPYAKLFIGRPHVFTVDIEISSQVEDAIREALLSQPIAYTPFEFTVLGIQTGLLLCQPFSSCACYYDNS